MYIRHHRSDDLYPMAIIMAACDLRDPLAMIYRRSSLNNTNNTNTSTNNTNVYDPKRAARIWTDHVKSTKRSIELKVLQPGCICQVIVLDPEDHDTATLQDGVTDPRTTNPKITDPRVINTRDVVGFAIFKRCGVSSRALGWQAEGRRLPTRVRSFVVHSSLEVSRSWDSSISISRLAQYIQRLYTAPPRAALGIPDERWDIEAIYVLPHHQRRGFGTTLLRWVIDRAVEEGVQMCVWSTEAGRALYLNAGFTEVGTIDFTDMREGNDGGQGMVRIMTWRLPN
ncbi:hypothetical protein BGW36DRAFT_404116 [Talaromyces proteolyticus]|uniref:N-acetyltransferase domain-containing protein n=1 Tax=Talaromyces proteolyticus TaxID=1131652 RepID=A0AAD4L198_9EURO|nr:uncharacterized protein BGW36DRAFT_404116 [Talaromyces proteolyticus]KAH8703801.1 hypothetical protein BGW36DRAFT_404116 [Talaromyces proteolyticus]